jgi:hypothetical protein
MALAIDGGEKQRPKPFPERHLFGAEEKVAKLRASGDKVIHAPPCIFP